MMVHALDKINGSKSTAYESTDISWVLTVPAIWDNKAKQIMRKAAIQAGLCTHPHQLRLALEPETASLECRNERLRNDESPLQRGTTYMVVDCGGGTVDITCHEVINMYKVKERIPPSGGNWGSTYIDASYEDFLCELFGDDVIETFKFEKSAEWVDTMDKWESCKIRATGEEKQRSVPLSFSLTRYLEENCEGLGGIKNVCKKYTNNLRNEIEFIKYREGNLQFSSALLIRKLFNPILEKIVNHVENLYLHDLKQDLDHIFIVGGFAESPILVKQLKRLGEKYNMSVTVPLRPGLAVVMGAVRFGLAPESITSRRSKYTYGCGTTTSEVSGHPEHRIEKDKKNSNRVYRIFDKFVTVHEEVDCNKIVTSRFYPLYEDQESVSFKLYISSDPFPNYTDESSVKQVGVISINIPDTTGGKDRPIEVSMKFGGTEVEVTATVVHSQKTAHATIDFNCI